jgi:hypothetical protein
MATVLRESAIVIAALSGRALMQGRPALAESRLDIGASLIKGIYKHEQYRDAID